MDIRLMIKQLRNAADSLEVLLLIEKNQNEVVANKILKRKYKRTKKHWTQTAWGKKRLSENTKKMWSKKS